MQLHAVSLGHETLASFTEKALQIYDLVDFIHIRERHWTVQQYVKVIEKLREHDHALDKLVINDRLDVAAMYQIHRVHLPSHSHDVDDVKRHYPHLYIGRSIHGVIEAKQEAAFQVDYMFFGHIYQTNSKEGLQARGIQQLQQVINAVSVPIIAIGGITPENIDQVMDAGPAGVAIMSGIFAADDCREAAAQYREKINNRKVDKHGSYN